MSAHKIIMGWAIESSVLVNPGNGCSKELQQNFEKGETKDTRTEQMSSLFHVENYKTVKLPLR